MAEERAPANGGMPGKGELPGRGEIKDRPWHAVAVDEAVATLQSDPENGLGGDAVEQRRAKFGENRLTPKSRRTALKRLISQFNNLFIYLLLIATVVTALLGEWLDSAVIFAVVLIIAIIGFVQEGRAERALEAVGDILSPKARVLRDGERRDIAAAEVVPGDIVLLDSGDRVPADLRLIEAKNLQTQEAVLTGESTAVGKAVEPVDEDSALGDRASIAHSGTLVTAGQGKGLVVAIGDATEIGQISSMLAEVETLRTPLMQRLDQFTRVLSAAIVSLALFTFLVGVVGWGREWAEMFFAAVSIAVAAIPQGLPALMTVTLAVGVERMANRNAIIRRLPAVETLGAVTIICADKTGTLTRNEMTAKTIRTANEDIEIEGVGYEPEGGFSLDERAIEFDDHPTARDMVRCGLLCNDAEVRLEDDRWTPVGDPTEAALIVLARKAGFEPDRENEAYRRLDVIPFASERRYMATLNRDAEGNHVIYVKGAPERVLEMCEREVREGDVVDLDAAAWRERAEAIAGRGQRLLAVARKEVGEQNELGEEEAEQGLVMLGLFGLIDPPRQEAIDAVAACQSAGIRVKMITGDHATTASAVARELGLDNPDEALTGRDLEDVDDEALRERAREVDVFARTSPELKLRLVEALQAENEVTAMTGDGVNDAPALKRADIGIAMGQKGTEVAREASEMVLADDNFASIERAVEEGRTVYGNLKKAILFVLPTNAGEALIIVAAVLFGMALPVTPVQILWVNMVTAVTLGMAFAWERAERDVMQRPPRSADEPLLGLAGIWRIGLVGVLMLLGAGMLFTQAQAQEELSLEYARTMAVNALVMSQIFYLLNVRVYHDPAYTLEGLFGSRVVLLAMAACAVFQVLFTHVPFMNTLFGTAPLDAWGWLQCIAVGIGIFILVEIEKTVRRRNPQLASASLRAQTG